MRSLVVIMVLGVLSIGCNVAVLEGTVVDIKGETLPGVAVQVNDDEATAVTDIHGHYRVGYNPGKVVVRFMKTGYTPGRLELEAGGHGSLTAATMSLWPLPQYYGVYLYEDFRYRDTMPLVPERWDTITQQVVYGTERWGGVETSNPDPLILCYRMPANGLRLSQLDITEVTPKYEQAANITIEVWAPTRTIPVTPVMIDEVDGQLMKVGLPEPLAPGCYAVHWGALDGDTTSGETRMFLFHVAEHYPAAEVKEEPAAASEAETAGDKQEAPEKKQPAAKEEAREERPASGERPADAPRTGESPAPEPPRAETAMPEEAPLDEFPDEAPR